MFKRILFKANRSLYLSSKTNFSSVPNIKRFYKNVSILKSDQDKYEIILDKRKLKTPKGNVFFTPNEVLASLVASEWDSQKDKVELNQMHFTTLTNTVIDDPNNLSIDSATEKILSFFESDTLCFRMPQPEDLLNLQTKSWDPVVQWFADFFHCSVPVTQNVILPEIDEKTRVALTNYFKSFNIWSLVGLLFATENLKSIILTCALFNRQLSVKEAIQLSRIEEDYQSKIWGKVEFHHDLENYVLQTRVAAAVLFALLNCGKSSVSHKL